MNDIVKRLRHMADALENGLFADSFVSPHREAADEIERLREALERIVNKFDGTQNQAYFNLIRIAREALKDE